MTCGVKMVSNGVNPNPARFVIICEFFYTLLFFVTFVTFVTYYYLSADFIEFPSVSMK